MKAIGAIIALLSSSNMIFIPLNKISIAQLLLGAKK
jgi:hypothetical protein